MSFNKKYMNSNELNTSMTQSEKHKNRPNSDIEEINNRIFLAEGETPTQRSYHLDVVVKLAFMAAMGGFLFG